MNVNLMHLIGAALVPAVLGFLWYNPKVFGTAWMNASGMTDEKMKGGNMAVIFGVSFLLSLVVAYFMNVIAYHDSFIIGSLYYETNGTMIPDPASDSGKWFEYYKTHLASSNHTFAHGAFHGAFIGGIGIALPVLGTNALFERKGFKYIAINAGYWIVTLALMGGIVAAGA